MYSIRITGRGGEGSKSAAEILGKAAFKQGYYVQDFALYGAERKGAPVDSFVRIDDKEIHVRGYIDKPDCIIIMDDTLLKNESTLKGLAPNGLVLINTSKSVDEVKKEIKGKARIAIIDATSVALEILGKPIFNTCLLAAYTKVDNRIDLKSMQDAVADYLGRRHGETIEKNIKAMNAAVDKVKVY